MEKIWRWAVIGSGKIVEQFLKGAAHEPRFHLEGIYSRTQERAQAFAQKVCGGRPFCGGGPFPRLFTSLEALAADPYIDAVYIASPNALHAQQTILMLEHGKHVLCEKPFAASLPEAEAMLAAARKGAPHAGSQSEAGAPLVLMEAMKTTLLPNFLRIREALPKLGPIRRYFAQFCQYSSRYDAFKERGVIPNVFDPAMAGGSLLDLGVYGLAPLVHLFGMPPVASAASPVAASPVAPPAVASPVASAASSVAASAIASPAAAYPVAASAASSVAASAIASPEVASSAASAASSVAASAIASPEVASSAASAASPASAYPVAPPAAASPVASAASPAAAYPVAPPAAASPVASAASPAAAYPVAPPAAASPVASPSSSASSSAFSSVPAWLQASALPLSTGVDAQGTVVINYPQMQAVVVHSKISDSTIPSEIQGENGRIVLDKLSTMIHPHLFLRDGTQEDLSVPTVPDDMFYEIHEFTHLMDTGQAQSAENSWSRTIDVMQLMDWAKAFLQV